MSYQSAVNTALCDALGIDPMITGKVVITIKPNQSPQIVIEQVAYSDKLEAFASVVKSATITHYAEDSPNAKI
jgi:hypothetical protein